MDDEEIKQKFREVWDAINQLKDRRIQSDDVQLVSRKNSAQDEIKLLIQRLIGEDRFFEFNPIRNTSEIIERIYVKFGKTIPSNHAVDYFLRTDLLGRDKIKPSSKNPKGLFIWFIPNTPKEKVEEYKRKIENG